MELIYIILIIVAVMVAVAGAFFMVGIMRSTENKMVKSMTGNLSFPTDEPSQFVKPGSAAAPLAQPLDLAFIPESNEKQGLGEYFSQ
jgi:flagellar basal body-associated protein FliL